MTTTRSDSNVPPSAWLSRYTAEDRQLRFAEARELVDLLGAVGRHDQVAHLRLKRFLRRRGVRGGGRSSSVTP